MGRTWPLSAIAGVAVIILFCAFTFTAWGLLYPTAYNPLANWLSDLGNSSYNPNGAVFFNLGCVLTGIALFPMFIGLYKWYTEENWRTVSLVATQVIGCGAAFSLIMIGVFSEDYGWVHTAWSSAFFVLNLLVLILINVSLFNHTSYIKPIAYYGFAAAAIDLVFMLLVNMPILEWFTVFLALGYAGLLSYNMVTRTRVFRE